MRRYLLGAFALCIAASSHVRAQEPVAWGQGADISFHGATNHVCGQRCVRSSFPIG